MDRILAGLVVLVLLAAGAGAFVAVAGDNSVTLEFQPDVVEAEPGETVEIAVVAQSDGGHDGNGIYKSTLRLEYPGEYVDVVDVEAGPWFHQDGEVDLAVDSRVDNDAGVMELDQRMQDPDEGITGAETFATVTVEIDGEAPSSSLRLRADNSEFILAVTQFLLPVFERPGEIQVGDGGERIEPDVPDDFEFEESNEDSAVSEDSDQTGSTSEDDDSTESGADEASGETGEGTDEERDEVGDDTEPADSTPITEYLVPAGVVAVLLGIAGLIVVRTRE